MRDNYPLKQWILHGHACGDTEFILKCLICEIINLMLIYFSSVALPCSDVHGDKSFNGIMFACIFTHLLTLQTTEQIFEYRRFAVETNIHMEKKKTVMRCYLELNMP